MDRSVALYLHSQTDRLADGGLKRNLETIGKIEALEAPRTRHEFRTQLSALYHRRQDELDAAITEMFVYGAGQKRVGEAGTTLTGTRLSTAAVLRVLCVFYLFSA